MIVPVWIVMAFLFCLGASVGSFLNVVAYRVPRDMSVVRPGSRCPRCKHAIGWYDNVPVLSWVLLRGRCRHCGGSFSGQYAAVELLTGVLFAGFYWFYFVRGGRGWMPGFGQGGWLVYAGQMVLVSALLASSLVDREHWVIPLGVPYVAAAVGLVLSAVGPYVVAVEGANMWRVMPYASGRAGALGLGCVAGLLVAGLLVKVGVLKRSFADWDEDGPLGGAVSQGHGDEEGEVGEDRSGNGEGPAGAVAGLDDDQSVGATVGTRAEMVREMAFLAPVVLLGVGAAWLVSADDGLGCWWSEMVAEQKWLAGLLGSVFGFMMGGAIVWATRIFGSLAFGREAMGLGDVHLMAAVGAVLGGISPVIAFFVAPFMGLAWAAAHLIIHRRREIPYGPFLSAGTVVVMIFHDPIVNYFLAAVTGPMTGR